MTPKYVVHAYIPITIDMIQKIKSSGNNVLFIPQITYVRRRRSGTVTNCIVLVSRERVYRVLSQNSGVTSVAILKATSRERQTIE